MSDPGISQNSACCKDFNDASARNSSELWTIKFRSVQVLLQLRTLGLCSQPIVMFSLSVERGQEPGGWRIWRCRWWSEWGLGLCAGKSRFYCVSFQAPRMDKCVSYYLSMKEADGVCVGFVWDASTAAMVTMLLIKKLETLWPEWTSAFFTLKHLLGLTDGERKKEMDRPSETYKLPLYQTLIREIPKKGLIHLAGLLFLIESNHFISMVNIISWRWRLPLGFLSLWHLYRSSTCKRSFWIHIWKVLRGAFDSRDWTPAGALPSNWPVEQMKQRKVEKIKF